MRQKSFTLLHDADAFVWFTRACFQHPHSSIVVQPSSFSLHCWPPTPSILLAASAM